MSSSLVIPDNFGRHVHRSSSEAVIRSKIAAKVRQRCLRVSTRALDRALILRQYFGGPKVNVLDYALVVQEDIYQHVPLVNFTAS